MATVFGLQPAYFSCMKFWLNRTIQSDPENTFQVIDYPNNPLGGEPNAATGAAALDDVLVNTYGPKIVMGHSMGAQVIYKWLRDYGPTSTVDPSPTNVYFITTGCPERKYGGAFRVPVTPYYLGQPVQAIYGGNGFPDDTPFTVQDYARQYDFWADHPSAATVTDVALENVSHGVHMDYFRVSIEDTNLVTWTEGVTGNITYGVFPTYPVGSLQRLLSWTRSSLEDILADDEALRPQVEACYDRPVPIPDPY